MFLGLRQIAFFHEHGAEVAVSFEIIWIQPQRGFKFGFGLDGPPCGDSSAVALADAVPPWKTTRLLDAHGMLQGVRSASGRTRLDLAELGE